MTPTRASYRSRVTSAEGIGSRVGSTVQVRPKSSLAMRRAVAFRKAGVRATKRIRPSASTRISS